MNSWIMLFVLAGIPFASGPYEKEDCLHIAYHHSIKFNSNALCVNKDNLYWRVKPNGGHS